jgi:glutaminyl-tRNA synthetase
MFDSCVREVLNVTAHRAMAVLEPLKVTISNLPSDLSMIEVPNIPGDESAGFHQVPIQKVIYIERTDFKEKTDKDYKRLALDQSVGLRHAGFVITVTDVKKGSNGDVTELSATCEPSTTAKKPKAFIHWVSDPLDCEIRIYERLFNHPNPENPAEVPGGYLTDINKESLSVITNAMVDRSVSASPPLTRFQFERIGFFCVDSSSNGGKLVFNRTISLREDSGKK